MPSLLLNIKVGWLTRPLISNLVGVSDLSVAYTPKSTLQPPGRLAYLPSDKQSFIQLEYLTWVLAYTPKSTLQPQGRLAYLPLEK